MEKYLTGRIFDMLEKNGLVKKKDIKAMQERMEKGSKMGMVNAIVESGMVSDRDLMKILSSELNIPPIDLSRVNMDSDVMGLIPEKLIKRYSVVPLSKIGTELVLVVFDPTDIIAIDDVKTVTGCNIGLILATRRDIQEVLKSFYRTEEEEVSEIIEKSDEIFAGVEIVDRPEGFDVLEITKESAKAPIVKMVDLIITEAIEKRASDIHFEPEESALHVRYRIDGELHAAFDLPKKNQNAVVARIKIMSNLDITENRLPQDGRFRIKLGEKEIDFRVSSLPISFGNKIVLRVLDRENLSKGLDNLGFLPGPLSDFKKAVLSPFGIILVTGPTGSGKSTTLYSIINDLNVPEKNIVTIEDPVEYQIPGITQIPVRPEIGLDFANGLRAILRQTPDIVMVGEIRDFDTADIAIKASLTGQLVFSTLHTNDAIGAITRLVNMGIEPFLVASSLVMTCAQRLLRKICPYCKEEAEIPDKLLRQIKDKYAEARGAAIFYRGAGCERCARTGYRGRMGTLETVLLDDTIRDMITRKESEESIRKYLMSRGWKDLRDNAMIKFIKGWTTLEEVLRAT